MAAVAQSHDYPSFSPLPEYEYESSSSSSSSLTNSDQSSSLVERLEPLSLCDGVSFPAPRHHYSGCFPISIPEYECESSSNCNKSLLDRFGPLLPCRGRTSVSFLASRHDDDDATWSASVPIKKKIVITGDRFTVDGQLRYTNHPENAAFIQSIKNYELPQEFDEPGMYDILIVIGGPILPS